MAEKNYGTIKIPEPAYDHHNERRQDMGVTWEAYINGNAPEVPNHAKLDTEALGSELAEKIREVRAADREELTPLADLDAEEIQERLKRIESAAKEATNAAQSAKRSVEELGGSR